ncbi:MAG: SGNH/GDSL hydrolase family protein [Chloroflexota bacterium]
MKALLGRLIAIGFGLLFAIILIEAIGRWLHLLPVALDEAYFDVREDVGAYPEPYSYFWWSNSETNERIWVQFNSASRRDIEHEYDKPDDVTRIMFLGDSYTAGWQHPIDQTYVARLRDWVGQGVQVLNAGFHGWGTDRQYLYYRGEGYRYDSDLVVLQIYVGNDVIDNGVGVLQAVTLEDGRLIAPYVQAPVRPYFTLNDDDELVFTPPRRLHPTRSEQVGGIRSFLRTYSFTYTLIEQLFSTAGIPSLITADDAQQATELPIDYYAYSPESQQRDDWAQAWAITEALLITLRDEIEAHGGELVVLLVDTRWQHDRVGYQEFLTDWDIPDDWTGEQLGNQMRDLLDTLDIPYLAPLPALLEFEDQTGNLINLRRDGHWSDVGHCVVAVELHKWLLGNNRITTNEETITPLEQCS